MPRARRLMAVLAHPDDESLGFGGTLAKYASEGVEVFLLTATRGDGGRYRGLPRGDEQHPGRSALGQIREAELRAAASALGIREVSVLDYEDGHLEAANPRDAIGRIAAALRRVQPDVVVTFGPDGGYGHPDHIAISQFATAAIVAAADPGVITNDGAAQRRIRCQNSTIRPGRDRRGPPMRQESRSCPPRSMASNVSPHRGPTGRSPR